MDVKELIRVLAKNGHGLTINPRFKEGVGHSVKFSLIDLELERAVDMNVTPETIFETPEELKIIERIFDDLIKSLVNNDRIETVPQEEKQPDFRPITLSCLGCHRPIQTKYYTPTGSIVDYYCPICKEKKLKNANFG